jgi:hypothetical protein
MVWDKCGVGGGWDYCGVLGGEECDLNWDSMFGICKVTIG